MVFGKLLPPSLKNGGVFKLSIYLNIYFCFFFYCVGILPTPSVDASLL